MSRQVGGATTNLSACPRRRSAIPHHDPFPPPPVSREHYGGFQIHNAATRKLFLMQAATQVMLFFGPRREDEPAETFEEVGDLLPTAH